MNNNIDRELAKSLTDNGKAPFCKDPLGKAIREKSTKILKTKNMFEWVNDFVNVDAKQIEAEYPLLISQIEVHGNSTLTSSDVMKILIAAGYGCYQTEISKAMNLERRTVYKYIKKYKDIVDIIRMKCTGKSFIKGQLMRLYFSSLQRYAAEKLNPIDILKLMIKLNSSSLAEVLRDVTKEGKNAKVLTGIEITDAKQELEKLRRTNINGSFETKEINK